MWRAYATGPDKDVLIGPNFKPFYAQDRGKDLGVKTWQGEQWKIGGGTGWSWISYDPDLDLIYYGTSNPGPVECRSAARAITNGHARCSRAVPKPAKRSGLTR